MIELETISPSHHYATLTPIRCTSSRQQRLVMYLDVLQEDAPPSLILERHELVAMLALLFTVLLEELRES